jgi:hypothetical protein
MNQQLKQLYRQAETNGDTKDFNLEVLEASLNVPALTEALVTLIVVRNLSFAIVEWLEFHTLCQVLNKASKGKIAIAHSIVRNKVEEAWKKHKDVVRRIL